MRVTFVRDTDQVTYIVFYFFCFTDDLHAAKVCYGAFLNLLIMVVMFMILYRTIIGFQDDIVVRSYDALGRLTGNTSAQRSSS